MYKRIALVIIFSLAIFGGLVPFLISTQSDTGVALGCGIIFLAIYFGGNVIQFIKGEKNEK